MQMDCSIIIIIYIIIIILNNYYEGITQYKKNCT